MSIKGQAGTCWRCDRPYSEHEDGGIPEYIDNAAANVRRMKEGGKPIKHRIIIDSREGGEITERLARRCPTQT